MVAYAAAAACADSCCSIDVPGNWPPIRRSTRSLRVATPAARSPSAEARSRFPAMIRERRKTSSSTRSRAPSRSAEASSAWVASCSRASARSRSEQ